jgi:hypothetical protein
MHENLPALGKSVKFAAVKGACVSQTTVQEKTIVEVGCVFLALFNIRISLSLLDKMSK